jgi:hypothetical protein
VITRLVLFLSLIASEASAITIQCSPDDFNRIGQKASMRIELPAGGPDALKEAFRGHASIHNLRFASTWGVDREPFPRDYPPTIFVSTGGQGVLVIVKPGTDTADIAIQTTCYGNEDWEPHWNEIAIFVAGNSYRILESIDSRELRKAWLRDLRLSLAPLTAVETE